MSNENVIIKVEDGSIANELGISAGDILLHINKKEINDIFDYRYLIQDEYIEVGILKPNNEEWLLEIDKDEFEDLGIVFERGLMDKAKSCSNKCIFCFIDQNPKGMRKTIYFKDDDSRLSFLQGNYITLTNMKEKDLERVIFYHLSPINISVHCTDMEIRKFMLKNPNSTKLMEVLDRLSQNNIQMNFQIVLCKGINDGIYLDKSILDLSKYIPNGRSLSVVPFGMTKHRDGLFDIELFNKEDCLKIINQVEAYQKQFFEQYGTRFVFISDEFYLKAGIKFPLSEIYEDYYQLENGIGMISLMESEFNEYLSELQGDDVAREFSVATSTGAYDFIKKLCDKLALKFINTVIHVYKIQNDFFGENITVAGLLTGIDILNQVKGSPLGRVLFVPDNAIRADETIFLDDMDISDLEKHLNVIVKTSSDDGKSFINQFIKEN